MQLEEIRAALERELSFRDGINSALVTTILDKIVVKKNSTKEEIDLDVHLKFGGPWEAAFDRAVFRRQNKLINIYWNINI